MTSYGASKFALRALRTGLREEEPLLRVTTIYPGRTATDMQRAVRAYESGTFEADQYLRPSTVAGVIARCWRRRPTPCPGGERASRGYLLRFWPSVAI